MALDLFGPTAGAGGVTSRPGDSRSFTTTDTFFKDCSSPSLDDGTEFQAAWFNEILANLRGLTRGNGQTAGSADIVVQDNTDDALLLKAVQHLIQRAQPSYALDTGSANQVVVSLSPAPPEKKAGMVIRFKKMNADNTSTMTVIVNGLGPDPLKRGDGADVSAGDVKANLPYQAIWDAGLSAWVLLNYIGLGGSAVSPTKILELNIPSATQSFPVGTVTKVTCLSSVIRNTLSTSTWDGQNFTVGAGEAGLWAVSWRASFGNISQSIYVPTARVRSGVTKFFADGFMSTGNGDTFAQANELIDLQVGDVVNFYCCLQGTLSSAVLQPMGPPPGAAIAATNVSMWRVLGLS